MKIVGIIAEYNPFHNGHQYHIKEAKRLTGADAVIVVMSGNFVQRGAPAIMPKHFRTEAALKAGASLVIELPVCYATGSAERFAYGAVSMLHKLGCVDFICFGSECGDIDVLQKLAELLYEEPQSYKELLQTKLRSGHSFPAARSAAIKDMFPNECFSSVLDKPNNILGIEYLKALKRLNSKIKPVTLERKISEYKDKALREGYSSASAIRHAIQTSGIETMTSEVPSATFSLLREGYGKHYPINSNDFSLLLKYRLLNENKISVLRFADVSEELANRIYNKMNQFENFKQFCELLKTKELTYTRISRALLHVLLEIEKDNILDIEYARVLGFCKKDVEIFSEIKRHTSIPLISKLSATKEFSEKAKQMLDLEIKSSHIYNSVITEKFTTVFINEYEHPIVRI